MEEEDEGGSALPLFSEEREEDKYEVMSEVHLGCPPHLSGPHLSHFTFPSPREFDTNGRRYVEGTTPNYPLISLDEDGDLLLTRRKKAPKNCRMTIQHNITSTIPSVGLQVWRAELVLADFVLHGMFTSYNFDGITAVELGAGTGLLGILLARVAKTVFLTDYQPDLNIAPIVMLDIPVKEVLKSSDEENSAKHMLNHRYYFIMRMMRTHTNLRTRGYHGHDILDNCAINVQLNSEIFENHQTSVCVRELDWNMDWPPLVGRNDGTAEERYKYSWTPSEIEKAENASVLLAADVIYSDELTDALFSTLQILMSRGSEKVLYLALEKRYNFSVNDLNVVANGYSHFRSYLKDEEECRQLGKELLPCFVGKLDDLADIPQYVREYDREDNVEIWEIKYLR